MSKSNFTEEFKRDAVRQITERGYPVAEVSQRLGVSQHSLYEWKKKFAASNAKGNDETEEIRRDRLAPGWRSAWKRRNGHRCQGASVKQANDLTRAQNSRNGFRTNSMRAPVWAMPQERQAPMNRFYSRCVWSLPDMRRPKYPDPAPLASPSQWENTTGSVSAGVHIRPSQLTALPHPESPMKAACKGPRSRGADQTIAGLVLHPP